jgi:LysM repeat protein
MRIFIKYISLAGVVLVPWVGGAQLTNSAGSTATNSPMPVPAPSPVLSGSEKLLRLEKKAGERDELANEVQILEAKLEKERAENSGDRKTSTGSRLKDLEWQASGYVALQAVVQKKSDEIVGLTQSLGVASNTIQTLMAEIVLLKSQLAASSNRVLELSEIEIRQRATIDQLLLGSFEYYEVKAGDTLESIAKNPMIYNDASRRDWLRRANHNRIPDLDKLSEGDLLLIPRFPVNSQFAF